MYKRLNYLDKNLMYNPQQFKFDLIASIVVFLVAIPLCLGIALASGVPLLSGLLSGVLGGVVVGLFSHSQVSVSGPAAGMAALIVTTSAQLGGFPAFLLALFLAGLIQIIAGTFRAGVISEYIPSHVVQGLLCAIGILLIIKQLPLSFTHTSDFSHLKLDLLGTTEEFALNPLLGLMHHINAGALIISILSLTCLFFFDNTENKHLKAIPAPIVVVLLGAIINECFTIFETPFVQDSPNLVNVPAHHGLFDLAQQLQFPDWHVLKNPQVYLYALIIAIVASLETLLNIKASEKIDPQKRHCDKDRELTAQGIANALAGLLGAIPITSVIVRTSINIQAGSKTKLSSILHGLFILFAILLIPNWLNKIPLSSLAAILIYTGYKLNKPAIYADIYRQGLDRFIPFIATVLSIVFFNLLTGILIGLLISLFYILKSNSQARFDIIKEIYPKSVASRLLLPQQLSFLNKASLIAELDAIPKNSQLIIDARHSQYIDKEIIELLREFKEEQAPNRQIAVNLEGFKDHYAIHNYIDFINVTTYEIQEKLYPYEILGVLREGNQRFLSDTRIHRSTKTDIYYTARDQHPIAVVLGCIDSRVPVETIFDVGFGDLFCVRIAGNIVNDDILASIEYACHVIGAKMIIVLGHTRCGAIAAACDGFQNGHITALLEKIQPAIEAEQSTQTDRTSDNHNFISHVTRLNIAHTLHEVFERSPILQKMILQDDIGLVGAIYHVEKGHVEFIDAQNDLQQLYGNDALTVIEKTRYVLDEAGMLP